MKMGGAAAGKVNIRETITVVLQSLWKQNIKEKLII